MLAGLVAATLPCPDAGKEVVAGLAADLLAGEAGADLTAGVPTALVALPVSLLGSTDLA